MEKARQKSNSKQSGRTGAQTSRVHSPRADMASHGETVVATGQTSSAKPKYGLVIFIIGLMMLTMGGVFLAWRLSFASDISDAEYLVKKGDWVLLMQPVCDTEPCDPTPLPAVVWTFTDYGKGVLTTDAHSNDYDFLWTIEGDKLKIATDWLYTLNNEYTYNLDRGVNKLTLKNSSDSYTFVPLNED